MKKGIIICFLFCMLFVNSNFNAYADNKVVALDRHVAGFEKVLKDAESDPYNKYGIYSSRIIAVKHPEIYLQGDMIFAEHITSNQGYAKAYLEKPDSTFLNTYTPKAEDKPFDFDMVDLAKYQVVPKEAIYGANLPVFGYLDERISPVQLTLKVNRITSLEGANLIYTIKRVKGNPAGNMFIIFTKSNMGFVFDAGKYYDCLGREVQKDSIKNPVLIFNEQAVWYPLMERDDTGQDANLKRLVEALATPNNIPELTGIEEKLLPGLKKASSLITEQMNFASIASISINYSSKISFVDKLNPKVVSEVSNICDRKFAVYMFINLLGMKKGDYLSPYTAFLAEKVSVNTLDSLKQLETSYLDRVGTTKPWMKGIQQYSAWGHSWPCGLIENNIEDACRTHGGHCVSQATNLSTILDLVGIENIHFTFLAMNAMKSHTIIYLPQYKKTLDDSLLLGLDYYKENYKSGWQGPEIKEIMVGDRILILTDDFIYTNVSKEEAYVMHRQADELGKEIFGSGAIISYKEKPTLLDMMRYKTFMIP